MAECIQPGFALMSLYSLFMIDIQSHCFLLNCCWSSAYIYVLTMFSWWFAVTNLKCFEMFALRALIKSLWLSNLKFFCCIIFSKPRILQCLWWTCLLLNVSVIGIEGILLKEAVQCHELLEDWCLVSTARLPNVYSVGDVKAVKNQKARRCFALSHNKMPDIQTEMQGGK